MKRLIAVLLAAGFLAAGALVAFAAEPPAEAKFEAKNGAVTFNHTLHTGKVADCATCHHTGVEGDKVSCRACHGVDAAAPSMKDTAHKFCKGCHKDQNGPTKCNECHKK